MRVWGQSPQQAGWKIGIQNPNERFDNAVPAQILNVKDQAVAFSGQGYRDLADNRIYSTHIQVSLCKQWNSVWLWGNALLMPMLWQLL